MVKDIKLIVITDVPRCEERPCQSSTDSQMPVSEVESLCSPFLCALSCDNNIATRCSCLFARVQGGKGSEVTIEPVVFAKRSGARVPYG